MPVGAAPDIVHVVPDMALSASYRPLLGPLRADGIPKPSRNAWYLDADTNKYKRLTVAVRAEIADGGALRSLLGVRHTVRLAAAERRVGPSLEDR